ncbi:MAG: hypothetical protein ACYC5N_00555, partial [Endomicrobiales bacterium]
EILDLMEGKEFVTFTDILIRQPTRHCLVVSFLAILELIRLNQIVARQSELFEEIRVYRVNDTACATPENGEQQGEEALRGTELYEAQQPEEPGAGEGTDGAGDAATSPEGTDPVTPAHREENEA